MYKIFAVVLLLATASAVPVDHQATSFASFNNNHNSVHHIQSAAPAASYYSAPAVAKVAIPAVAKVAIPAVAKLAVPAATSYYSSPVHQYSDDHHSAHYAAPVHQAYAAPVHQAYAAPVHQAYAAPAHQVYSAPAITKVALPVAKIAQVSYAAPIAKYAAAPAYAHQEEYAPAKYEFAYAVQDHHTGDFHSQEEHRDGDHVVGQYSLHEADGTVRIVKYSDDGHGFNAIVERQGHPTEAPVVYKKVVAVAAPQYGHHY